MTLPTPEAGYIATIGEVCTRLQVVEADLTDPQRDAIRAALWDAAADVEDALYRPIIPTDKAFTGVTPFPGFALDDWHAWPPAYDFDDEVRVKSRAVQSDGTYNITLSVGLDGPNTAGVRRFVIAAATNVIRESPDVALGNRQVTSLSADGQSVSYAQSTTAAAGGDSTRGPGAAPTIEALKRAHMRRSSGVYARREGSQPPWPYGGIGR